MTADSKKNSTHCLVCNSKIGVSTRNSIQVFNDTSLLPSNKSLIDTICTVLKTEINQETVHSLVICKKCYKLFNEVRNHFALRIENFWIVDEQLSTPG